MGGFVRCLGVVMIIAFLCGCERGVDRDDTIDELFETDRAFSALSVEEGVTAAFERYAAEDAVIYRDQRHPVEGREAIRTLMTSDGGMLTWEPTFADVAESGDLGYTLGKYDYAFTDDAGDEQHSYGYYVSIWKRQPDGEWRYVFDGGITAPVGVTDE